MAKDTTYNGWTNYATWRINLELCSDYLEAMREDGELDGYDDVHRLAELLEEYTEEIVVGDNNSLMSSYALAFLDGVNWYEIAEIALRD